jgi:hypothetical protein
MKVDTQMKVYESDATTPIDAMQDMPMHAAQFLNDCTV